MKFFMVIGKNVISTYVTSEKDFLPQMIEGSEKYKYSINSVNEDLESYLEALSNEKNLGTKAKLEFDVLECSDDFYNKAVISTLEAYIDRKYDINEAMIKIVKKLSRDKDLLVNEFGVNYDGNSYIMQGNELVKQPYNLLAYGLHCDDVMGMLDL